MLQDIHFTNFILGENHPLVVFSGPCVIESQELAFSTAKTLKEICSKVGLPLVYKSSYDKANRSSSSSFRGPGLQEGLRILENVKKEFSLPILTDVHTPQEAAAAAQVCDVIQVPAFLCRQTDLLLACGDTKAIVNIKKGQFMAPWDIKNAVDKILSRGNNRIILTERGASFGYNNLVSDMRSIPIMKSLGFPVCFDASHSVQLPGGNGTSSGGQREFIPTLAQAAVAAGCNSLFIESHPNPQEALSDKDSVFPLQELLPLLTKLKQIHEIVRLP